MLWALCGCTVVVVEVKGSTVIVSPNIKLQEEINHEKGDLTVTRCTGV